MKIISNFILQILFTIFTCISKNTKLRLFKTICFFNTQNLVSQGSYVCTLWNSYVNCRTRAISRPKIVEDWNVSWYIPLNKKGKVEYTEHVENIFKYRARKILKDSQMHLYGGKKKEKLGTREKDNGALDISNLPEP